MLSPFPDGRFGCAQLGHVKNASTVMRPNAGTTFRLSSGNGEANGLIVDKSNGEGCGVVCRVSKPNKK